MWEGNKTCLKWYNINNYNVKNYISASRPRLADRSFISNYISPLTQKTILFNSKRKFHTTGKIRSDLRIGPHHIDIISILIGSILGDTHLEKRKNGTRIIFEQCSRNVEYIMWFHNFFATRGYCSLNKPKLTTRIKKGNKIFYQYRVSSFTFTSFNWLHSMFYVNGKKIIPRNLEMYLTPLALAIWFRHDGSKLGKGAKIATNCFCVKDLEFLCLLLKNKYNLEFSIHSGGKDKGYSLDIKSTSMSNFSSIIKPYILPCLCYKLGD